MLDSHVQILNMGCVCVGGRGMGEAQRVSVCTWHINFRVEGGGLRT